jgi:hypothetical protein
MSYEIDQPSLCGNYTQLGVAVNNDIQHSKTIYEHIVTTMVKYTIKCIFIIPR